MQSITNLVYRPEYPDTCLLDLHLPDTNSASPLFLYFHGGGLESGERSCPFLYDLPEKFGIAVASADYRLYPCARYPDFVEDAAACAAFIHAYDKNRFSQIFIGGSSAGGYLSMMLCFARQFLAQYGLAPTDFAGFLHDAGQPTVHFNILRERGLDTRLVRIDETCPIWYIDHTPQQKDVPPMYILYAQHDMKNRPEQTELLYRTMEHFGYPMEKIRMHCFPDFQHCQYDFVNDTDGINLLAKTIASFILER